MPPLPSLRVTALRDLVDQLRYASRDALLRDLDRESASFVVLNAVQWNATQAFMYGSPEEIDATAAATSDLVARYIFRE